MCQSKSSYGRVSTTASSAVHYGVAGLIPGGRAKGTYRRIRLELLYTWHDTALRNGRQPHRLMDLVGIGPDHDDVLQGGTAVPQTLASTQEAALLSILANHTTSPRSWFVLWWGDYHGSAVISEQSLLEVDHGPSSDYCVFTGPHRAWKDFWTYPDGGGPTTDPGAGTPGSTWTRRTAPTSAHPANASRRSSPTRSSKQSSTTPTTPSSPRIPSIGRNPDRRPNAESGVRSRGP
jgi:hypothetical protein